MAAQGSSVQQWFTKPGRLWQNGCGHDWHLLCCPCHCQLPGGKELTWSNLEKAHFIKAKKRAHLTKAKTPLRPASLAPQPGRWRLVSSGFHLLILTHPNTIKSTPRKRENQFFIDNLKYELYVRASNKDFGLNFDVFQGNAGWVQLFGPRQHCARLRITMSWNFTL